MKTPRDYQEVGIQTLVDKKRFCLFDDMGTGKSFQSLEAARRLGAQKFIVICPKTVKYNWEEEAKDVFPGTPIFVLDGDPADRDEQLRAFRTMKKGILIAGYGHIISRKGSKFDWENTFAKLPVDGVIVDEVHRAKNRQSERHKSIAKIAKFNEKGFLFLLTGTPIRSRLYEWWSYLRFLYPREYTSFWKFIDKYFSKVFVPYKPFPEIGMPIDASLYGDFVQKHMIRRTKHDIAELPDKTFVYTYVDLDTSQKVAYTTMKKNMYMEWKGKEVEATQVIAQAIRLKQITVSPNVITGEVGLEGAKIDALLDIMEDVGDQKVIIFSQFAEVIKRIPMLFGKAFGKGVFFTGSTPARTRQDCIDAINCDPETKWMATTTQCGEGYNATGATVAIFLDWMWTPAENAQAVDRIHRIGQSNPVTIYVLMARETIDTHILKLVTHRDQLFSSVLGDSEIKKAIVEYVVGE